MKVFQYDAVPKPEEIAPDVYRIVIPQPFYAPNNIYLITSGEPTLIDTGYVQNLGLLQRSLRKLGLSFHDIEHVVYTHDHVDHISGALTLRFYTDAKMYGMLGMADAVGDYREHIRRFQRAMNRLIYKAHPDKEVRQKELDRSEKGWHRFFDSVEHSGKLQPHLRFDVELREGDVISVGGRELGFLYTPGHNCWHLTPYILGEGIYFTGDLILENISAVYSEVDGNLEDYRRSLDRLLKLPIKRILPAHGKEPQDPHRAIRLLSKTLALLERGVMRRLKEKDHDLAELVHDSMGEKVKDSPHYLTAIAMIHSMVLELIKRGEAAILEVDPPYERYTWTGPG
ncbi:MAG: MBL fold metallo-hydrolase [Spirochaetia bacterium]|nr:MBL fold metallo-hydrolase [Spirochaetia bacterium]